MRHLEPCITRWAPPRRLTKSPWKAKVADLSRRLAEAEEALKAAADPGPEAAAADGQRKLLIEAQRTLSIEHNLLRTVIDIIPDHVFVRDRASRHLINNRAQLDVLRAGALEDTRGKTDFDFSPAEMARRFHEANEQVMSSGTTLANIEEFIPGPHGEPFGGRPQSVPLRDASGAVIGLKVGIGRNITESACRSCRRSPSRPRCWTRPTTPSSR